MNKSLSEVTCSVRKGSDMTVYSQALHRLEGIKHREC